MRLDQFDNSGFVRGRSRPVEALWRLLEGLLFNSWFPGSAWRISLLRLFGAQIGNGVVIKPYVKIKFPWKLTIGDHSWIGEKAWIDNLAEVRIGNHCCISQGVYICTGNHRWDADSFDLVTAAVQVEDHCWIGSKARLAPGVVCRTGSVLSIGSVATKNLEPWQIHTGVPAQASKERPRIRKQPDD